MTVSDSRNDRSPQSSASVDAAGVGEVVGSSEFTPVPGMPGLYRCGWPGGGRYDILLMVTFAGGDFPFEDFCRYALHRNAGTPYTFSNLEFREKLPGLMVGPWPGWRGIPEMPPSRFRCGNAAHPLAYQFWGDEIALRCVRGVGMLPHAADGEILVECADPRLVPERAEFFAFQRPAVSPVEFQVSENRRSGHPRLLVSQEQLEDIREVSRSDRAHSYALIQELLKAWDEPIRKTPESKIAAGREGCSDEDRLLIGAFVALIDRGEASRERAVRAFFDYLQKTREVDFEPLTIDTQSGEVLFLLCVGYDWLHDQFSAGQRGEARQRLWEVADICWGHLGYERRDYAQAHFLGCGLGLLAFALLFRDEHPRGKEWAEYLHGVLRWVLRAQPADGFFAHGINLWIYEYGFLLRWLELFRSAAGIDLWDEYPVLAASSRFRMTATSPDGLCGITMGDPQYRVGGDSWCHYLIAARTGSPEAQWLGDFLRNLPVAGVDFRSAPARRRVYEYLWRDDRVTPRSQEARLNFFDDGGQVFVRTTDSVFTFRSGGPMGAHRYRCGILGGYGHSDPCNGSFLYYRDGLLGISGPGPVYRRESLLHNIVTIDDRGQVGDSTVWLPDFFPASRIPSSPARRIEGGMLALSSDITPAYLPHLGVRRVHRSLLIEPGRFVLGTDDVLLGEVRRIQWNIHSAGEFRTGNPGRMEVPDGIREFGIHPGTGRPIRLMVAAPAASDWCSGFSEYVPAYPNDGSRDRYLRISVRAKSARFFWCLILADDISVVPAAGKGFVRFSDGAEAVYDGSWISLDTRS